MSDLAPAASPSVVAAASARRGESRWWVVARTAFPFLVVALAWEVTAHLGIFPRKLFPPLEDVAAALVRLTADGVLPHHVLDTLLRLLAGFALAAVAGVAIGFAMGRSRRAEDVFLPLVSIGAPIPGSPTRRCSCCGSASATQQPCCLSPSSPPFLSSSTPGPG